MTRQVKWNTLPDAITRTPHPPRPTEADLELCPTCIYIPIPNRTMCEKNFRWGDGAYGLAPPPDQFTTHIPDRTVSRIEIATDALIRAAATHRNAPLEASREMIDTLDALIQTMEQGRDGWNRLLQDYDPARVEYTNGRECKDARTHRPTATEVRAYSDRLNAMGERLRDRIDQAQADLNARHLLNRPPDGHDRRHVHRRSRDESVRRHSRRSDPILEDGYWPIDI